MKKHLRLLAWVLSLAMLCQVVPVAAFAESGVGTVLASVAARVLEQENSTVVDSGSCGDNVTWTLDSDGVLTVSGTGAMANYGDHSYDEKTPWFDYVDDIVEVNIDSGITSIGDYAFFNCYRPTSIVIPDSVTSIGEGAFYCCSSLESVVIPDGVSTIERATFHSCSKLTSVTIPKGVGTIGRTAFYACYALPSITLPEGMVSIQEGAFGYCGSLTSVTLPNSLSAIDYGSFNACSKLSDVYYHGTQEQWNNIIISYRDNAPLQAATIHYQESTDNFSFSKDIFNFINSSDSRFESEYGIPYGFNKTPAYPLSSKRYKQLTYGLGPIEKQIVWNNIHQEWFGSCYGMVLIAALHYVTPERIPLSQFGVNSVYELDVPRLNSEVEDFINYYQFLQSLPTVILFQKDRAKYCKEHTIAAINDIITNLREGHPIAACLDGHEILLLSVKNEYDDYYEINVYDPASLEVRVLELWKASEDGYGIEINYRSGINDELATNSYGELHCYLRTTGSDLKILDIRNYFQIDDNEKLAFWPDASISFDGNMTAEIRIGSDFITIQDGNFVNSSFDLANLFFRHLNYDVPDGNVPGEVYFTPPASTETLSMEITSVGNHSTGIFLNDGYLSLSTSGPAELTYNEADRTVDVKSTSGSPIQVNVSFTQNTPSDAWPWHSWAIDTTDTTELHAELDNDGLHLTGDGISGAVVATENAETEKTDTITLPAKAEGETTQKVTISSKKDASDDDKLTIDGSDSGSTDPNPTDPSKPSGGSDSGTITPTPTNPAAPSGGSGDGDSGAGALLVVGGVAAAAAITAGVVLSMPVEVQGKAELADHTPLAGAKIALLQDGKVVEQTTADATGAFSVKVKRGEYQLTAAYTNADGQIVHQTVNIKAPAKDVTVTF